MRQLKLVYLVANLVFVRLAIGSISTTAEETTTSTSEQLRDYQTSLSTESVFDTINSLDYSPSGHMNTTQTNNNNSSDPAPVRLLNRENGTQNETMSTLIGNRAGKSFKRKQMGKKNGKSSNSMAHLLLNLLGQLEKVDMKRLISDSLTQFASSGGRQSSASDSIRGRHSEAADKQVANNQRNSTSKQSSQVSGHTRDQRLNVSALTAESGNLLSITEQLVKLARSSMLGSEYAYGAGSPLSSWSMSPMMAPSMLSAASHMLHDSFGHDFTGASLKSDWFWLVAPAVIVIGAGVIVIPLIAAWLVSNMMSQNTFTVAAGRRRKRSINGWDRSHDDLLKLLDIHQLLEDAPELLVNKLSEFHRVLDSVGAKYFESTLFGNKQTKPSESASASGSDKKRS